MSDYYKDDGWLVVVTTERMGGGSPLTEAYVVATKNESDAKATVQKMLSSGQRIHGLVRQSAGVMETYSLFPGKWTTLPVANP